MKNPLNKRLLRDLRQEIGKYLVIFLMIGLTIAVVSGFLVAAESMVKAYNDSFEKYNIENGHFEVADKLNKAQLKDVGELDISIYDNFYYETVLDNDSTMRIFADRKEVNKVCLMDGAMPEQDDEIAIDRMYADNNDLEPGDTITDGKRTWKITGLVALSDYSALFADNNDTMFDAIKFGVAIVTEDAFAQFPEAEEHFIYSWIYDQQPKDETEESEISEDLMEDLSDLIVLKDYVPRYQNQAIQFTGEDMVSDKGSMIAMLYIVIAIMAFVFGITINNTIAKEANVIGTLRATGYTKQELIRHYMMMPMIITLIAAIIGNILGYTVLKDYCASLYYGSYSLPTYVTIWSSYAFIMTTVVPLLLMLVITYFVLRSKLKLSPLKFLRRDLTKKKNRKALRLNKHIPFFTRFRLRIIFQNVPNYMMLFIGIIFANMLLFFGLAFPALLDNFEADISKNMLADYQYILDVPVSVTNNDSKLDTIIQYMMYQNEVETDNEDAEKFSVYQLNTIPEQSIYKTEEIMLYGLEENSKYVPVSFEGDQVYISSAYASKYGLEKGDTIQLKEKYKDDTYTFTIGGVYYYEGALAVFMPMEMLNETFDFDDDFFAGYFSNSEITDIDSEYIGSVIDLEDMTKISRQLQKSMGSIMNMICWFAIIIFMVLIYLLSKIIIEKNAQSISMSKILGYGNREISSLYIITTTVMVLAFILISIPIEDAIMKLIFKLLMLTSMTGWITYRILPITYIEMVVMGMVTYCVVALFEYRKIRKVPMDEALKNVE